MSKTQCNRCRLIGPVCRCDLCSRTRSANEICPQCKRDFLFELGDGYACDRCYYQATTERHAAYKQRLAQREAPALSEAEKLDRDIREAFDLTTARTAPGGSDDGIAMVGVEWMERAQAREGPEVTGRELLLHKARVQRISGHRPVASTIVAKAIAHAVQVQKGKGEEQ